MLRDFRDAGRAHVFQYRAACDISAGTKHSTAFSLALSIFAEGHWKVKEFSRKASLALKI